jgi:hypothetical protein
MKSIKFIHTPAIFLALFFCEVHNLHVFSVSQLLHTLFLFSSISSLSLPSRRSTFIGVIRYLLCP